MEDAYFCDDFLCLQQGHSKSTVNCMWNEIAVDIASCYRSTGLHE